MGRTSRNPPPVLYPLRRSRALGGLLVVTSLLGAGVLAGWMGSSGGPVRGWPTAIALCAWLLAAGGALHFWWHQLSGTIRWDGQFWAVAGLKQPDGAFSALFVPPEVLLDVQSHLWVLVSPAGHRRLWLWLERSSQPERWMDLRRAVYSRAKPGVDHADASAPASSRGA